MNKKSNSSNNAINKKVKTYCDTNAYDGIDLGMYPQVILSKEEKIEYLNQIIGKIHKALHLIEEEGETGYSPSPYMSGIMIELNAADPLYNNKFVIFEGISLCIVLMISFFPPNTIDVLFGDGSK